MDQQNKTEATPVEELETVSAEETPAIPDETIEAPAAVTPVIDDDNDDDDEDDAPAEPVPTEFQKKIAAIPENKWRLYQIIGGIILGALTVITLFYRTDANSGTVSYGFLLAICLALFGPNYIEKQGKREIWLGRKWLCITMGVGMVIAVLIMGFSTNWQIFAPTN